MMKYLTPKCPRCGESSIFELAPKKVARWQRGELVQKVFPEMSWDDRETLITGYHPDCWDLDMDIYALNEETWDGNSEVPD